MTTVQFSLLVNLCSQRKSLTESVAVCTQRELEVRTSLMPQYSQYMPITPAALSSVVLPYLSLVYKKKFLQNHMEKLSLFERVRKYCRPLQFCYSSGGGCKTSLTTMRDCVSKYDVIFCNYVKFVGFCEKCVHIKSRDLFIPSSLLTFQFLVSCRADMDTLSHCYKMFI